jgi:hypothetical protein
MCNARTALRIHALGGRITARHQPRQLRIDERETGSQPAPSAGGSGSVASRLCLIGVKVDTALRRDIDAYAETHGVSRSRAAGHFFSIGREAIHEREGVPGSRADEWEQAVTEAERDLQETAVGPVQGERH